jgi:ECF transporter S component (folate family)
MKIRNNDWLKEYASINTKSLVMMGLLIAIEIVLTRFVSIQAWNLRIGFGFIPIAIAGMMLGPIRAGIVAAVADVIGAILFPAGTFFPGFTLTALLVGILYGIFLYKKTNTGRIFMAIGIHQIILSLLLNTLWISILYGSPYWPLFTTRILQTAIMLPVEAICLVALCNKKVSRILAFK